MRLLHVAVQRLQVKLQLAEMLGLEFLDLQFDVNETPEAAVKEKEVDFKVFPANLNWIMAAYKTEISPQLNVKMLELFEKGVVQVAFGMVRRQVQELEEVGVLEDGFGTGVQFSHRWCEYWRRGVRLAQTRLH